MSKVCRIHGARYCLLDMLGTLSVLSVSFCSLIGRNAQRCFKNKKLGNICTKKEIHKCTYSQLPVHTLMWCGDSSSSKEHTPHWCPTAQLSELFAQTQCTSLCTDESHIVALNNTAASVAGRAVLAVCSIIILSYYTSLVPLYKCTHMMNTSFGEVPYNAEYWF